jgi:hypothetical protein
MSWLAALAATAALLVVGAGCGSAGGVQAPVAAGCDPNYSGACLDPHTSDYDCQGGSGNGPAYTGTVTVVGEDHYGLDADADGTGCESY